MKWSLISILSYFILGVQCGSKPLNGVAYNPYNLQGCSSVQEVEDGIIKLSTLTNSIRLYRSSCNQVYNVINTIIKYNLELTVFLGLWIREGDSNFNSELQSMVSTLQQNPNFIQYIKMVSIGNEELYNDPSQKGNLIQKIQFTKSQLSQFGLQVGTCDVDTEWDTDVASVCDFIGINVQPYFSGRPEQNLPIERSIDDINFSLQTIQSKSLGKQVIISEIGFPSAGAPCNAYGTLSTQKQFGFFQTVYCNKLPPYYIMEGYDAIYKSSGLNGGIEQHFGISNTDGTLKYGNLNQLTQCSSYQN
ncbi:glycoside hydrolase family 17 protein [Conidiobolus coronatus NRRL 28638]|uniref:glucan endo-1,3-beta-D-glucosidase n=1 Tax=Conidiobolus coronatus (strain ATCC 28846 / CBS 209.66 / NRRL 28638) TaxID=796925 RepID=A0A137PFE8_CONC2|nr:glycoside hydrolase family 17 protein [Conidiobolus coronatus NRRL 28638]|eukprot:KXN73695.1 glycoside hydrolase family 17 protein [Conidiobolus coronatus NRRL 28638]